MKGTNALLLLLALAACLMGGCASSESESEGGGASQAVEQFYGHLNDGKYDAALALYSAEVRGVLEDPDSASDSAFEEWAELETKEGKIDRVEVVEQQENPDGGASVHYRLVYSDDSKVVRTVTLSQEQGQWKLGFIN